jgi:uncharacterized membrane protein YccC
MSPHVLRRMKIIMPTQIQHAVSKHTQQLFPTHIQRIILRIIIAFPCAQLVTFLMGYGTSPTCLISTAMVLFSASPIETAVYKKMNERIFSNLLGLVIGLISMLLIQTPTVRIVIGGLMIVFVAHLFPKLNISPASTSVAMLIVTEAPRYEMYLSLQERALLAVIGCIIAYVVVRFIVPPRHHKTIYPKATRLSLEFIETLNASIVSNRKDLEIDGMRAALCRIKKETDRYCYIIDHMKSVTDDEFQTLAHVLKALNRLKMLIQFVIDHGPSFQQLDETYRVSFIAELSHNLHNHAALLLAEPPRTSPCGEDDYRFGHLPYNKDVTSFLYKLDKYHESLNALHVSFMALAVR